MKQSIQLFLLISVAIFASACTNDKLEPIDKDASCIILTATYKNQVKAIIDSSCAYSGCHAPGGTGVGNYTTYKGMLPFLISGTFRDRVVTKRTNPAEGMPPDKSVYTQSRKDDLTDEEFRILKCWIDAGFPEL